MPELGPLRPERVAVYTLTLPGLSVAERIQRVLPGSTLYLSAKYRALAPQKAVVFAEPIRELLQRTWALHDGHVFVMASGIVLRASASLLLDKRVDPAVLVVDPAGRFAIPLLSGHLGGANPLARYLAEALGMQAVLTTGTDSLGAPGTRYPPSPTSARTSRMRPAASLLARSRSASSFPVKRGRASRRFASGMCGPAMDRAREGRPSSFG